jgi:hypothetical protein
VDILSPIVEISPTLVREYILNEIEAQNSRTRQWLVDVSKEKTFVDNNVTPNHHQMPATPTLAAFDLASGSSATAVNESEASSTTTTSAVTSSSSLSFPAPPSINNIPVKDQADTASSSEPTTTQQNNSNNNINTSTSIYRLLTLSEVLNTDDVFEPILINFVIRQMINDPDEGF